MLQEIVTYVVLFSLGLICGVYLDHQTIKRIFYKNEETRKVFDEVMKE